MLVGVCISGFSFAAETPDPAVQSGRDALGPSGKFPWYDADKDALRPIPIQTNKPPRSDSSFHPKSSHHGNYSRHGTGSGSGSGGNGGSGGDGGGSGGGSDSSPSESPSWSMPSFGDMSFLMWIVWIVIAVVLLWLVWMVIRAFLNREAKNAKESESLGDDEAESSELPTDALPKKPPPRGGLLDEARRLYEAGRYSEAIVYLYSHELLKLDQAELIRLARGKTNRQYLRELSSQPELYKILEQTLVAFEDAYFGERELDRARFESVWTQIDRFNKLLETTSPQITVFGLR